MSAAPKRKPVLMASEPDWPLMEQVLDQLHIYKRKHHKTKLLYALAEILEKVQ